MAIVGHCAVCNAPVAADTTKQLATKLDKCRHGVSYELPRAVPIDIRLDKPVKSHNFFNKKHWTVYSSYKQEWLQAFKQVDLSELGRYLPYSEWLITRHYAGKEKLMDLGNVIGGFKPAVDCLVQLGVVEDDNPKHFSADYEQTRSDWSGTTFRLVTYASTPRRI